MVDGPSPGLVAALLQGFGQSCIAYPSHRQVPPVKRKGDVRPALRQLPSWSWVEGPRVRAARGIVESTPNLKDPLILGEYDSRGCAMQQLKDPFPHEGKSRLPPAHLLRVLVCVRVCL